MAQRVVYFNGKFVPESEARVSIFDSALMFVDMIFGSVAVPQARILQALLELEMSGLIRQLPGKNFIRKR